MTPQTLIQLSSKALPALSGASVVYDAQRNLYRTLGYTSNSGNFYYKAIRLSDRLAVHYDIGQGYAYTFLNGITVFAWDGRRAVIIGKKMWGGTNWVRFNERFAAEQTIQIVMNYLRAQAKLIGQSCSDQQLHSFSRQMVNNLHIPQKLIS